jgi:hypothetical protein
MWEASILGGDHIFVQIACGSIQRSNVCKCMNLHFGRGSLHTVYILCRLGSIVWEWPVFLHFAII